jgi:hypothetical protein
VSSTKSAYTIGNFAIDLARSLQLAPSDHSGFTPASASFALWRSGVRLRPSLDEALTETDLTAALRQIGFALTPSVPDRQVSADRAAVVLSTFVNGAAAERLRNINGSKRVAAQTSGNTDDDFNNGNGKGGKFKRKGPKSPGSDEP